ncbi:hypothetical protein [Aquimonas voraii]|uniref:IPTL-CTERM protein sorting domain-containing protein n=1 Tax=Aquimonas voraii TaxID=265719 RepID=A0A1G6YB03_9GAMM|nr:hypothetical protein [Aquimonas voraii]SDD87664.1 hypothetical protein SAMN04488509_10974 [Aquimonas voraii]
MKLKVKALTGLCLSIVGGLASAGTISVTPATATALQAGGATSPTPHAIVYAQAAMGETTNNFQGRLIYDSAILSATVTSGAAACTIPTPGTIVVVTQNFATPLLASGTVCEIAFSSVAGAAIGTTNLDFQFNAGLGDGCLDDQANAATCTINDATVNVITAPPDTNLAYTPAPGGTVTFPAGVALTTQNASIGITTTGTVGAGTISNCGITGTGAASFGPPPAGTISVNGGSTGTIPLTCTLPNSGGAATATLTCTETDADTPAPGAARSWTLSCPQGTPVPGPGFGASPATNTPATAINCSGQAGTSVTRQITITNNGNPGAGSALDFTCTGGGIVSITSGGSATGLAVGASQTVNVSCAVPADGVTSTGTVSCTSNAPGGPFVFNYSSTGSTLPPPVARPAVVPASSTWSQIALIALLAGLGLAFVGFRRGQ